MNKTEIDYLDFTWNPIAMRCTRVSPACDNCWHLRMANRLAKNPMIDAKTQAAYRGETWPLLLQKRLNEPFKRKKPSIIGVQFMGDLWHEAVFHRDILAVFGAALEAPWHTYVFLTKRSGRMLEITQRYCEYKKWPQLPDNWIGMVTVENQEWADRRIPDVLAAPWAVRGVSAEPLLGGINLYGLGIKCEHVAEACGTEKRYSGCHEGNCSANLCLDWFITGGETGPGARPSHPDWFRGLRDQCQVAGTNFFFKQWGEWVDYDNAPGYSSGINGGDYEERRVEHRWLYRVGNKRAGHLLDGQAWRQMPDLM